MKWFGRLLVLSFLLVVSVNQIKGACVGDIGCGTIAESYVRNCSGDTCVQCSQAEIDLDLCTYRFNCVFDYPACRSLGGTACSSACGSIACTIQWPGDACSYSTVIGPDPPPGGGGPYCPYPARVSPLSNDVCETFGLFGKAYPYNDTDFLSWTGYTCGPQIVPAASEIPLAGCWWTGYWDGYFHAEEAGTYDFLISVMPRGGMWIDLNQDDQDTLGCGTGPVSSGPTRILGDRFVWTDSSCDTQYRPEWLRELLTGVDPRPGCGVQGCDCWEGGVVGTQCDPEGRHCQFVDQNETGTLTPLLRPIVGYPQTPRYDTPSQYQVADPECIYNSGQGNLIGFDDHGQQIIHVQRSFTSAGYYQVGAWYDANVGDDANDTSRSMRFWYRSPSMDSFIETNTLNGNASCPFVNRPCAVVVDSCSLDVPDLGIRTTPNLNQFPVTVTETVNNGTIDSVSISVNNSGSCNPNIDSSTPYEDFSCSLGAGTSTITAGAMMGGIADICNNSSSVTLGQVRVNVYQTPGNGSCVGVPSTISGGTADLYGGDLAIGAPGNLSSDLTPFETQNPVNATTTFTTLIKSGTIYGLSYTTPAGWVLDTTCSNNGANRAFSWNGIGSPAANNFYITQAGAAWFKVDYGDVGTFDGDISTSVPSGRIFLGPDTLTESGVAIAGGLNNSVDIGTQGDLGPTIGDRDWSAEGVNLNDFANNGLWSDYFVRTFEQPIDPGNIIPGPISISNINFYNLARTQHNDETNSYILYVEGDLTIDDDLTINDGNKYTVFVTGDLNVEAQNINVVEGGFLGFVVDVDINFKNTAESIDGVYIADGIITVESANPVADEPFVGNGIFAGRTGVTLSRDLDPDGSTLDNNITPAEQFNYRSDLLYNAPLGFKRIPLAWQEVEPGTINQEDQP